MQVIAKTADGLLIQATEQEVMHILNAVNGTMPKEIILGQKIPAIDYAATISKIKSLNTHSDYTGFLYRYEELGKQILSFKIAVQKASEIVI